MQYSLMKNKLD